MWIPRTNSSDTSAVCRKRVRLSWNVLASTTMHSQNHIKFVFNKKYCAKHIIEGILLGHSLWRVCVRARARVCVNKSHLIKTGKSPPYWINSRPICFRLNWSSSRSSVNTIVGDKRSLLIEKYVQNVYTSIYKNDKTGKYEWTALLRVRNSFVMACRGQIVSELK